MKQIKRALATALLASGLCSTASAEIITQTYTPLVLNVNSYFPLTYVHDLRGYGLPGQVIKSASIALYLYDATDALGARAENVTLRFDGGPPNLVSDVSLLGQSYAFDLATSLLEDGLLRVSIRLDCDRFNRFGICTSPQDVMLARSVLTAEIRRPGEVPEPGTLLALAAGLLGLGAALRRTRPR